MNRLYKGNVPCEDKFCRVSVFELRGKSFGIFVDEPQFKKTGWANVKVVLLGGDRDVKANYRLSWSVREQVFAKTPELQIIIDHVPEMLDQVKHAVNQWNTNDACAK